MSCPVRVGLFLGYGRDADLATVFFPVSTLKCTLIGHVGFQPLTTDSRSNPTPEGFEPLTKSSRSNSPTNCTLWRPAVVRWSKALKNLKEAAESRETVSTTVDVTARKVEIEQTQQMLQETQKAHDKAITKLYKQLRNLLSGNAQSQWDRVCHKMHERDSWAAVNGQVTKGRRPRTWTSFLDCLELYKLTVFSADAAKRQQFYIQQAVRKPQRATVQRISCKWEC